MAQAKMDFVVNTRVDKTAFVELKKEIQALRGLTEKDLINFGSASNFQEAKKQLDAIKGSATTVEAALNKAFSPKLGTVSLTKFNQELKKIDLQGLANNFSKAGAAGATAFRSLTTNVLTTKIQIKETHKLLDDMGKTMSNTIKWGLSSSAWNTMTGSFQKAYNYVKDLDKSLNDIRIVSGQSADQMAKFAIEANRAAKTLGASTLDYTDAALIYYQQGLNEKQVRERTNATVKMANVLGANAEEVSNYMTAIWNNFDDGSKSIEYYADVLTKLGAATASSAEEISTGLEKFAAIADTVGLGYEYATAALTTVTATTRQSAEVVGTAFKTLFARIQDLELGETLDDGVTLGKYSEALKAVGINILDANQNMKDMDSILKEMGDKWGSLTKAQQVSLAQTVAGTRQYTQLVALMDNWDFFQQNLSMAASATGELNKQQEIYLESTKAHLDQLSASAERLYSSLIDSEGLNDLIDIFSGLVTGVSEYTEAIGGSKSVLLQLGNIATKAFGRTVSQGLATSITNFQKLKEQAKDFNAQAAIIQQFKGIKIDDASFNKLVDMAEGVHKYKETLSEAQVEEANAIMAGYNDAVNAREMWQEAKTYAENYYQFFTGEQAGSLDQIFSNEQLDVYFTKLDNEVLEYEKRLGSGKAEINKALESYSADTIEEYLESAQKMIETKIIKNEQLETKLKAILDKYAKAGPKDDENLLSDEQVKALNEFGDTYGKIADGVLKDTKKVKETFIEAQKGMSDANETAVKEMDGNWQDFINKIDIQSFSQHAMDLSGQLMSIASAVESIKGIPNIWSNDNLSTGEKMLQTVIAVANAAQGVANTFKLVHTTAQMLTATMLGNAGATGISTKALKDHEQEVDDNIKSYVILQEDIEKVTDAHDASQKEIKESTKQTIQNTSITDDNTKSVYQNTLVRQGNTEAVKDGTVAKQVESNIVDFSNKANVEEAKKLANQISSFDRLEEIQNTDEWQKLFNKYMGGQKRSFNASQKKKDGRQVTVDELFDLDEGQAGDDLKGLKDAATKKANMEWAKNHPSDLQTIWDATWSDSPKKDSDPGAKADELNEKTNEAKENLEELKDTLDDKDGGKKKGGLFKTLKGDLNDILTWVSAIPAPAAIAVAAIAAIAASAWLIAEAIETDKEKDKRLQEQVDKTTESYNEAVTAAQELSGTISDYQSGVDGLKGLTKGTVEYYEAIVNANQAAQELIDKLGLIAGTDYTLSPDGLIQINDEALTNAAKNAQKETYRAQAAVYYAKEQQARESTGGVYGTVKNARKDINKQLSEFGVGKGNLLSTEDVTNILEGKAGGRFKEVKEKDKFIGPELNPLNQEPIQLRQLPKAFETQTNKLDLLVQTNEKNNKLTEQSTKDITSTIAKYSAQYKAAQAQADSYALAAADQSIRGYGTDAQISAYENATSTGQNLMQQYVANQKKKNVKEVDEINSTAAAVGGGLLGGLVGGIGAGAAIGAAGGSVTVPILGTVIGTVGGAIIGGIAGAIGGAFSGKAIADNAKEKQEKQLKERYAENALGYTINDEGEWYDENNELVSKDQQKKILEEIDLETAKKAYESGDYYTDEALEKVQKQMYQDKQAALNATNADGSKRFDEESSRYISEALTAAKEGLDYDYSLLTEDEMAYFKEQITAIGNTTGTLGEYSDALAATSDPQKRLKQDTENYNTELDAQAQALDTTTTALKLYHKSLSAANKVSNELTKSTAEGVGSTYGFNKAWNAAVDTFEDAGDAYDMWLKSLKSGEEIPYDAADAVSELMTSLEKVLGFDLDADFMEANSKLIKDFMSEDKEVAEKAYKELKQLALENTLSNMGDYITDVQGFVDALEGLKAGENLSTDYANQLTAMLQNTQMTKEELENLFATMNLEMPDIENSPEWEQVTETKGGTKTVHHYEGTYPTGKLDKDGNIIAKPVKYSWTETVDPQEFTYWKPKKGAKTTYTKSGSSTSTASFARSYAATQKDKSGSKSEPKHEDRLEDELDRYHDVNIELKKISNSLDVLDKDLENLVGQSKIDNLTEQFRLLNKEIKTTEEKIGIAKGEMSELQGKLAAQGMTFAADGTISNYAAAYTAQLNNVNAVIDRYNAMSATQQESYQGTLDNAKEQFEKFKENLERYDTLLTDEIPSLKADIQEAINKQIELKLDAFHQEIEIRLEMSEAERNWNAFFNKVIKDIEDEDILGNTEARLEDFLSYYKDEMKGVVQVNTQHIQDILADLKAMDEGIAGQFYSKDGVNNRAQALEDLKTYYEQLMSDLEAVHDLSDEIHESYVAMINEAQEKFDEQISTFETLNNLIEHDKNMISMVYGNESYSTLAQFYDKQEENYNKQLDFQRQQVDFWQRQMELAEEGSDAWEAAKENWVSAVDAWNSSIETAIQNLQDKYLNAINAIFQALNNKVTGGMGLGYVETEWDLINKNADQYLDTVNAIYKVQELQNKYLDAIEKSSSPTQQKKLNDLMQQETDYLREQDKLSEYDLERANLKYEIALKQMALEEAQQNKSKLRLRRDSQGNYTYQYTQDEDQIASIQSEIADLYNQLYNLDAEAYRGNLEEIFSIWQEFQQRMSEAAQINDPEQRAAKELLIKEQYSDLINGLVEKNENLQANMYQSTMSHLFDLYNQNTANYEDMSEDQKAILDQFISAETDLNNAAFDNLFNLYNVNIEQFKEMTEQQKDILMNSILPQWNSGVQQMVDTITGEGGFTAVCKDAFEELDQATQDYTTGLEELQENAKVSFEEVKEGIDNVIIDTEKLLENNNELIEQYDGEIDAIRSVIDELEGLIKKYKEAEAAAKAASEEAYKYWQEEQNRNASADNKIDTPAPEENTSTKANNTPAPKPAAPAAPSLNYGSYISVKPGTRWYADSYGGGNSGTARAGTISYINPGAPYAYNIGGLGWVKKSDIVGYDTGGYTGEWSNNNGRLAMLHQKELVLNANDTTNMLSAISILRDITANLGATLLNKMASISAGSTGSIGQGLAAAGMEQNVVINAEFPNATSSKEIEDALNNLVNRASQHITK